MGSLILSATNVCISCILCWMVHGRYKFPKGVFNFFSDYCGKMSIPTRKSRETEAFEAHLEEMRQKAYQSFSTVPIKFERGNLNDCFQVGDERRCVELVRMNRLERMSRELLENSQNNFATNSQENVNQTDERVANQNENSIVKVLHAIQKDNQKMKDDLEALKIDIHYLALSRMQKAIDASVIGEQEMKHLAVILNRLTGILLTILNVGLMIYTGLQMFSA